MILIQVILISAFVYFLLRFLANPGSAQMAAWKKILGIAFVLLAATLVLLPETATQIAHFVGVGRGADLLLYLLTLAFVFTWLNMYMKSRQDEKQLVQLARKIALLEAKVDQKRK